MTTLTLKQIAAIEHDLAYDLRSEHIRALLADREVHIRNESVAFDRICTLQVTCRDLTEKVDGLQATLEKAKAAVQTASIHSNPQLVGKAILEALSLLSDLQ